MVNKKKNLVLIIAIISTLVLGSIAVVTALKLYQAGKEPVAPTAPASQPRAIEKACQFTLIVDGTTTPTPTPTGTIVPTPTDEPGPTATPEPTNTPIPTDTPVPTSTPVPQATAAPTTAPEVAAPTSAVPAVELPEAGIISPTILTILGGIVLTILGLVL